VCENAIFDRSEQNQTIIKWHIPKNFYEICALFKLVGYYRRFVPRFSFFAKSLNAKKGKEKTFAWTAKAQQALNQLKIALILLPIVPC